MPPTPLFLTPSLLVFHILIRNMHTEVMLLKLRHQRERERWLPSVTFGQSKSCVQCKGASKVCGARKDDGHKTMLYFIVMYCNRVAMMGRTAPSTTTASKSICSTNS